MEKIKGFVVTLKDDIYPDQAESITKAISLIKGVVSVDPVHTEFDDQIIESRSRSEFLCKILDFYTDIQNTKHKTMKTLIILLLLSVTASAQSIQFGTIKWSTENLNSGQYFTAQEMQSNPCPTGWEVPNRADWNYLMQFAPTDSTIFWVSDVLQTTKQGYSDWAGNIHFAGIYDAFWLSDQDHWVTLQGRNYCHYYSWRNLFYPGQVIKPETHVYPDLNPFFSETDYQLINVNGQWQIDTIQTEVSVYRYQIRCIQRTGTVPEVYHLIKGWSYVCPPQNYTFAQFFPDPSKLILVKDVHGQVYYPPMQINQIGSMVAGNLYLVRMNQTVNN